MTFCCLDRPKSFLLCQFECSRLSPLCSWSYSNHSKDSRSFLRPTEGNTRWSHKLTGILSSRLCNFLKSFCWCRWQSGCQYRLPQFSPVMIFQALSWGSFEVFCQLQSFEPEKFLENYNFHQDSNRSWWYLPSLRTGKFSEDSWRLLSKFFGRI